ncbi:MAG: oligosaccharide flippase family protein [Deltaproteobacteria bacterium]|nr:oligosaccharide flippase family protein [Deltaproteobacteria bacterium]MBF0523739.1 oligosaccharide flippase family protein [Deltaproteobacteria bacterium]MBF0523743.1 oligosaccharide flippase family protein [Deltaproteobacteria bacterium]
MIVRNTLANLIGQLIQPVLTLVLVPFYITYLTLEGYGLIVFFVTLETLLTNFVSGLSTALMRETAQSDSTAEARPSMWRLMRAFELAYVIVGVVFGLCISAFSGWISLHWISPDSISSATVKFCLLLLSVRLAAVFPGTVYQAVFIGTQRQVLLNTLNLICTIVRVSSNVIVILTWRSVAGFYLSEVVNTVLALFLLRYWVARVLPRPDATSKTIFDWTEVKKLWRISVDLILVNGAWAVLSQVDRLIISRLLSISALGVYNVLTAGGQLLAMAVQPFFQAVSPEICQLARHDKKIEMQRYLIRYSKVILIICLAVGLSVAFFARDILEVWTHNEIIVKNAPLMSFYVCGQIFLYLATVPYLGQVALGRVRFQAAYITVGLIWFPVSIWLLVPKIGIAGVVWTWVVYCFVCWLYDIMVTVILLGKGFLKEYAKMTALTAGAGCSLMWLVSHGATYAFPGWIWGRLFFAGAGAVVTGTVCYVLCFGFYIPQEIAVLFRKKT